VRVLVCPDKFKGTLTAPRAAAAIARGWRREDPAAFVETIPLADGGEGTLDALLATGGGARRGARVTGPLGEEVEASFGLLDVPGGPLGVVEMAAASGLQLVPPHLRDPRVTTSRGTGELMLAAVQAGARRLLVCLGGSATNDAGAGLAQALGIRLTDGNGREVGPGGAALSRVEHADSSGLLPPMRDVSVEVAVDVDNPLVGPSGASAVYGPQKGAAPDDVAELDAALTRFAEVVRRDTGADVAALPGGGAAGGVGAGLVALLGAELRSGAAVVMEAAGVADRMRGAHAVVTGEGRFDAQSLRGKVAGCVVDTARGAGVPGIVVLCGEAAIPAPEGVLLASLAGRFGPVEAVRHAGPLLERLAGEVAAKLPGSAPPGDAPGGEAPDGRGPAGE